MTSRWRAVNASALADNITLMLTTIILCIAVCSLKLKICKVVRLVNLAFSNKFVIHSFWLLIHCDWQHSCIWLRLLLNFWNVSLFCFTYRATAEIKTISSIWNGISSTVLFCFISFVRLLLLSNYANCAHMLSGGWCAVDCWAHFNSGSRLCRSAMPELNYVVMRPASAEVTRLGAPVWRARN